MAAGFIQQNLHFLLSMRGLFGGKRASNIQLVGDHLDSPAKAKGAAWTYGFKYFFLYKFRMKQETEDPDMKGHQMDLINQRKGWNIKNPKCR